MNKNANYAKSFYYRGKLYHKQKDYKKAIADFSKSISIRDNVADAWYWRGLTYFETAEWQKAIDDLPNLFP
ncbi:MAG: tetratricopeptide repeat protein [Bacteroidales bacterium]